MAEEAPVATEQPIATAPAKAVADAKMAEMLLALQKPQEEVAPVADPFARTPEAVAAEEAFKLSQGGGVGMSPPTVQAIHSAKIPRSAPMGLDSKIQDIGFPTVAEILGKATPINPSAAVQHARARMVEALSKIKASAASSVTPKFR